MERQNDLDWVRILAVLLLIPFHTARIFDTFEAFYIKNSELNAPLSFVIIFFLNKWQMAILFLVAGASTWYALGSRSGGKYIVERLKRLMIPFVFGTLVIVPPQMYFALLHRSGTTASFLKYYPTFFRLRPSGMPDYTGVGFTWGHLWFILNLFVISLVALPLLLGLKTKVGQRITAGLAGFLGKGPAVLLLALPVPFVRFLLPDIDGKPFFLYLLVFIYGFVLMSETGLRKALQENRWVALILGLACTAVDYAVVLSGVRFARFSLPDILLFFMNSFNTWFLLMAILGFAQKYLNSDSKVLRYAREAAYPFYLIHQTVIVAIAFYVVQLKAGALPKFLVICVVSLVLTVLLYDLVVRRVNVIRFLFGMKPKIRRIKTVRPTA
jgi:glucan biosynthesis protein C